ncbi:MAG: type VI secretion system contractile sheath large subunit, partial [Rhizobacter sp.]|nr:type VI secretion system contractile sheath large subunit [Rhizobacter sp.]
MAELNAEAQAAGAGLTTEGGAFEALLLQEFKPKSDRAKEAVEEAVRTLAEQALASSSIVSGDTL